MKAAINDIMQPITFRVAGLIETRRYLGSPDML
jgi:hypothetical protein